MIFRIINRGMHSINNRLQSWFIRISYAKTYNIKAFSLGFCNFSVNLRKKIRRNFF